MRSLAAAVGIGKSQTHATELIEERAKLLEQRAELKRELAELEQAATSEESLEVLLRKADVAGTLERVLERMGFDEVEVDEDGDA